MALDQLANDLKILLQSEFHDAQLCHFHWGMNSNNSPVYIMGSGMVGTQQGETEIRVSFSVFEEERQLMQSTAHTFYHACRSKILNNILGNTARIVNLSVDRNLAYAYGYTTTIELIVLDLESLKLNVKNFAWKRYSQQFDELIDKTLKA